VWYFELINLGAKKKKGCETKSSDSPTKKRHLVWTIENPGLLREQDQRCIDQTISLSAAYNDAQMLFKSVLYGIAFVCMCMPHCHGLICWHRATSGGRLPSTSYCLLLSLEEKGKGWQKGRQWQQETMKMANTGEIKPHRKAKDKRRYDGNLWVTARRLLRSSTITWSTREK